MENYVCFETLISSKASQVNNGFLQVDYSLKTNLQYYYDLTNKFTLNKSTGYTVAFHIFINLTPINSLFTQDCLFTRCYSPTLLQSPIANNKTEQHLISPASEIYGISGNVTYKVRQARTLSALPSLDCMLAVGLFF